MVDAGIAKIHVTDEIVCRCRVAMQKGVITAVVGDFIPLSLLDRIPPAGIAPGLACQYRAAIGGYGKALALIPGEAQVGLIVAYLCTADR